eukprot:5442833-Prymnesium_polylepis.1
MWGPSVRQLPTCRSSSTRCGARTSGVSANVRGCSWGAIHDAEDGSPNSQRDGGEHHRCRGVRCGDCNTDSSEGSKKRERQSGDAQRAAGPRGFRHRREPPRGNHGTHGDSQLRSRLLVEARVDKVG